MVKWLLGKANLIPLPWILVDYWFHLKNHSPKMGILGSFKNQIGLVKIQGGNH